MPISYTCSNCGKEHHMISDKFRGKKVRCTCGHTSRLPSEGEDSPRGLRPPPLPKPGKRKKNKAVAQESVQPIPKKSRDLQQEGKPELVKPEIVATEIVQPEVVKPKKKKRPKTGEDKPRSRSKRKIQLEGDGVDQPLVKDDFSDLDFLLGD